MLLEPGDVAALLDADQIDVESVGFEAKLASGGVPRSIWETISAFANTDGGTIVLGLREAETGWVVEGLAKPEHLRQGILTSLRDRDKISAEVCGERDVWVESVSGRQVLVVRIAPALRRDRPVYLNGDREMAYLRRGEADVRCTAHELDRMRREAGAELADFEALPFLNEHDFDWDAVRRFRDLCRLAHPERPHHLHDGLKFLEIIGAWRNDRQTGTAGPTFAGIMMFGNDLAIREIRPSHLIDYRRESATAPAGVRWLNRVEWSGHLFGAWESISPLLVRGLERPFRLEGAYRRDEASGWQNVREAFVNLLVHADYREHSDSVIVHYDDGYLFRNPGDSRLSPEELLIGGRSERRNPKIAEMFDHAGLADRAGSGFVRLLREWKELGYRTPRLASRRDAYEFELELRLVSLLAPQDIAWLESLEQDWKDEERLALVFARHEGAVDNQTLRRTSGLSILDASKILRSLRDRGYLTMIGAGRAARYILGSVCAPTLPHSGETLPDSNDALPHSGTALPDSNDALPGTDQRRLDASTERDASASMESRLAMMSASVARTRRTSPEVLRMTILALCAEYDLTIEDLARHLGRSLGHMQNVVAELVRSGALSPLLDPPNHPHQRYRTSHIERE